MTRIHLNPQEVQATQDGYIGELWLSSRAFIFPLHRWSDDVPSRLCELAQAVNTVARSSVSAKVVFGDAKHAITFDVDTGDDSMIKVIYADRTDAGLLYQERIERSNFEDEVARALRSMIEVSIRRHWSVPVAQMTDAMALPSIRQAGRRI